MPLCYSNGYPYHISCYSMCLCIYADMFRISKTILICCHVVSLCPYLDVFPWLYAHMSFISTHSISLIFYYADMPVWCLACIWVCIYVAMYSCFTGVFFWLYSLPRYVSMPICICVCMHVYFSYVIYLALTGMWLYVDGVMLKCPYLDILRGTMIICGNADMRWCGYASLSRYLVLP